MCFHAPKQDVETVIPCLLGRNLGLEEEGHRDGREAAAAKKPVRAVVQSQPPAAGDEPKRYVSFLGGRAKGG